MRQRKLIRISVLLFTGIGLALAFNNCGKGRSADDMSSLSGINFQTYNAADVCSEQDIEVFARGYHAFLSQQCKNCHVNGPGKGTFAHPDKATAFSGFQMLGFDKISQYAVSDAHKPPATGSQNLSIIQPLRLQWQTYMKDKATCSGGSASTVSDVFVPNYETRPQTIPQITAKTNTTTVNNMPVTTITFDSKEMIFDLSKELSALGSKQIPNLTDVKLKVTVTGYQLPSGQTAYLVTMPTLTVGGNSLRFKGLNFRINGFVVDYATTFKRIDMNIYQRTTELLSPGSLVAIGPMGSTDTLSVQIGELEIINLAAPPPLPTVQFKLAGLTIGQGQLGYTNKVAVRVQVVGENPAVISVPISFADAGAYAAGEKIANSVLGNGQNRFDWDYRLAPDSSLSLNFKPNEKEKFIELIFSDDLRDDVDKVLRLTLGNPLGATLGTQKTMRISIPDYNQPYVGSAPTFAQLMNPKSGVLGMNCVKCHNSVQRQGGYDMTDYEDMKTRGIIVPGNLDPNAHKMFRRMNANLPNLEGLQSMPLDGFLPAADVDFVNDWIRDGAKNN